MDHPVSLWEIGDWSLFVRVSSGRREREHGNGRRARRSSLSATNPPHPNSNDSWIMVRDHIFTPSGYIEFTSGMLTALSSSSSSHEVLVKLEETGMIGRLDVSVRPLRMKSATVTLAELERLRSISTVVRRGRIMRVGTKEIVFEQGAMALPENCVRRF